MKLQGTVNFGNVFLNEGNGDHTAGGDIRLSGAGLITSGGVLYVVFDDDNTNDGSLIISKGSRTIGTETALLTIQSNGLIQSQITATTYAGLVVNDKDIPNKKYIDDSVAAVNGNYVEVSGDSMIGTLNANSGFNATTATIGTLSVTNKAFITDGATLPATPVNALHVYTDGHFSDGGEDSGITIESFEPTLEWKDRSSSTSNFLMMANSNALSIQTDPEADGTYDELITISDGGNFTAVGPVQTNAGQVIIKGQAADVTNTAYLDFRNSSNSRVGRAGFISSSNNLLYVQNETDGVIVESANNITLDAGGSSSIVSVQGSSNGWQYLDIVSNVASADPVLRLRNTANSDEWAIHNDGSSNSNLDIRFDNTKVASLDTSGNFTAISSGSFANQFTKNLIINGSFDVRQFSSASGNTSGYACDNCKINYSGTTNGSYTSGIAGTESAGTDARYYLNLSVSSTQATVASNDIRTVQMFVEGYDTFRLKWGSSSAKSVTLSFWTAHSVTGTYYVAIRNSADDLSYVIPYTQTTAGSFQKQTVTITGPTSGTWESTTLAGLVIEFVITAGSDSQTTTTESWITGPKLCKSDQTQIMQTTSAQFRISAVQLEVGTQASVFEYVPYTHQLRQCQRFYEKSLTTSYGSLSFWSGYSTSGNPRFTNTRFSQPKRTAPTMTLTGVVASGMDNTPVLSASALDGFTVYEAGTTTGTAYYTVQWVADSRY